MSRCLSHAVILALLVGCEPGKSSGAQDAGQPDAGLPDGGAQDAGRSYAPVGKFLPAATVIYGKNSFPADPTELALLDLLDTGAQDFGGSGPAYLDAGNAWNALHTLNPHMAIVVYVMGAAQYVNAWWGFLGDGGWSWITQAHGADAGDRWAEIGATSGAYLATPAYPTELVMDVGNSNWRQFWIDNALPEFLGPARGWDTSGLDGIFSDNSTFEPMNMPNGLYAVGPDGGIANGAVGENAVDFVLPDGGIDRARWANGMSLFLDSAASALASRSQLLVPNFGSQDTHPEDWLALDNLAHPPFAAMEEAAFFDPWAQDCSRFLSASGWLNQVNTVSTLTHVHPWEWVHCTVAPSCPALRADAGPTACRDALDCVDDAGTRASDVLWFGMGSALLAMRTDTWMYFGFRVDNQPRACVPDELNPVYLHLGSPVGPMQVVPQGLDAGVYFREFTDGWVFVNPNASSSGVLLLPADGGLLFDHSNFQDGGSGALVRSFNLPAHRAAFFLKPGHAIGSSDNP